MLTILSPKKQLERALNELRILPSNHIPVEYTNGKHGWHMYLQDQEENGKSSYPGVYSTSFAIQLLCSSNLNGEKEVQNLIGSAFLYLVSQYAEATQVKERKGNKGKQAAKMRELGHTDFHLILKYCSVLDAAQSIAEVRNVNEEFGQILQQSEDQIDNLAQELKDASQLSMDPNDVENLCWPWHIIDNSARPNVIPTVHATLALTHESIKASSRFLDKIEPVTNYLNSALASNISMVHKAIACRALLTLEARFDREFLKDNLRQDFSKELELELNSLSAISSQEVLHYEVPSKDHAVSHYKPWLWICPRLELVQCYMLLTPSRASQFAYTEAAELMLNAQSHGGEIRFFSSQPPNLFGNIRAERFLNVLNENLLTNISAQSQFALTRFNVSIRHLFYRHIKWVWAILIALVINQFFPVFSTIFEADSVQLSLDIIWIALTKLYETLFIWIIVFLGSMLFTDGSFKQRFLKSLRFFFTTILIAILVGLVTNLS